MAPRFRVPSCVTLVLVAVRMLTWTTPSVPLVAATAVLTTASPRHGGWGHPLIQGTNNSKVPDVNLTNFSLISPASRLEKPKPRLANQHQSTFGQGEEVTRSIIDNIDLYEKNSNRNVLSSSPGNNNEATTEGRSSQSTISFTSFVKDTQSTRGTGRSLVGPSALFLKRLKKLERNHVLKTSEPKIFSGPPGTVKPIPKFFGSISIERSSIPPSTSDQTSSSHRSLHRNKRPKTSSSNAGPTATACVPAHSFLCSNGTRSVSHAGLNKSSSKAVFEPHPNRKDGTKQKNNTLTDKVQIKKRKTIHSFLTNLPSGDIFFSIGNPRSENFLTTKKASNPLQNSSRNSKTNNKTKSFRSFLGPAMNEHNTTIGSTVSQPQRPVTANLKKTNEQSRVYKNSLVRDKVGPLKDRPKNLATKFFGKANIRGLPELHDHDTTRKRQPSFPSVITSVPSTSGPLTRAPWKAPRMVHSSNLSNSKLHAAKTSLENTERDSGKSHAPPILPRHRNNRLSSLLVPLPLEQQEPEKIVVYPPLSNTRNVSLSIGNNNLASTSAFLFNAEEQRRKAKGPENKLGERFPKETFPQKISSRGSAPQSPIRPLHPVILSPNSSSNFLMDKESTSVASPSNQFIGVNLNITLPVHQNFNSTFVPWPAKDTVSHAYGVAIPRLTNDPNFRIARPSFHVSKGVTLLPSVENSRSSHENNYSKMVNRSLSFFSSSAKKRQNAMNSFKNGSVNVSFNSALRFENSTNIAKQKEEKHSSTVNKFSHLQKKPSLTFDSNSFENIPSLSPELLQSVKPPKMNRTRAEKGIPTVGTSLPTIKRNKVPFENIKQSFLRNVVPSELSEHFLNPGTISSIGGGKNHTPYRIDTSFNNKYKHSTYKLTYKIGPSQSNKKPLGIKYMKYNPLLSLPVKTNFTRTYKPRQVPLYEMSSRGKAFAGIPDIINEYFNKTNGLMIRIPRAKDGEILLKKRKVNPLEAEKGTSLRYENVLAIVNPETNVVISLKSNGSLSNLFDSLSGNINSEKSIGNESDNVTEGIERKFIELDDVQLQDEDSSPPKTSAPDIRPIPQPTKFVMDDQNIIEQFNTSDTENLADTSMSGDTDNDTASIQDWLDFFESYDDVAPDVLPDYYNPEENDFISPSNSAQPDATNRNRSESQVRAFMESLGKVLHISEPDTLDKFQYSKAVYKSPFTPSIITSLKSYLKINEGHSAYAELLNDESLRGSNRSHKNEIIEIIRPEIEEDYVEEQNTDLTNIPRLMMSNNYSEAERDLAGNSGETPSFQEYTKITDHKDYFIEESYEDEPLEAEEGNTTDYYNDGDTQDELAQQPHENLEEESYMEELIPEIQVNNSDESNATEPDKDAFSLENSDTLDDDLVKMVFEESSEIYSSGDASKPIIELPNINPSSSLTSPDLLSEKSLTGERGNSRFNAPSDENNFEDEHTMESNTPHLPKLFDATPATLCLSQQCSGSQAAFAEPEDGNEQRNVHKSSRKRTSSNKAPPPYLFQVSKKDGLHYNDRTSTYDYSDKIRNPIQRRDPLFREALARNKGWKTGKKLSLSELLKQNTLNTYALEADVYPPSVYRTATSRTHGNMGISNKVTPYQFPDAYVSLRQHPLLNEQDFSLSPARGSRPWSQKKIIERPSEYGRFPTAFPGAGNVDVDVPRIKGTQNVPPMVNFGLDLSHDSRSRYASRKLRKGFLQPVEASTYTYMDSRSYGKNMHFGSSNLVPAGSTYVHNYSPTLYYNVGRLVHPLVSAGTRLSGIASNAQNNFGIKTLFREATEEMRYSQQHSEFAPALTRYYRK